MQEALELFDSLCNSRWFVTTPMILFLDDTDVFAEKLSQSPLGYHFPDYIGDDDYGAACDFVQHRFVSLNQCGAGKQIYTYYTCTTDIQQMKRSCPYC
jgi:guanine nucleotide-binding protein G(i) subunit alpha